MEIRHLCIQVDYVPIHRSYLLFTWLYDSLFTAVDTIGECGSESEWTEWFNLGNPSRDGDFELISHYVSALKGMPISHNPST